MPPACVSDLRALAQRRIPRWIFDYVDGGSYEEQTIRANRADFAAIGLLQRVMIDVSERRCGVEVLGKSIAAPLALAPTGLAGFVHADGEIAAARAAAAAGIPFCLSTVSICSIEEVAAATTEPFWFQIYVMRDRDFTRSLIERAKAAHCSALVLTLDLQISAQRHRDIRNGLSVPPRLTLRNLVEMALKPAWSFGIVGAGKYSFGNLKGAANSGNSALGFAQWIAQSFDPSLNWNDVAWVRSLWPGKLILKGVLDVEDAKAAVAAGADAIVVSNHGGRQLDGARSSISALPEIAEAVGDRVEIYLDGGVQTGQDVLKAVALGARCCLIGKAYLYGLGADGERGVRQALNFIARELDVSMALTGLTDIRNARGALLTSGGN